MTRPFRTTESGRRPGDAAPARWPRPSPGDRCMDREDNTPPRARAAEGGRQQRRGRSQTARRPPGGTGPPGATRRSGENRKRPAATGARGGQVAGPDPDGGGAMPEVRRARSTCSISCRRRSSYIWRRWSLVSPGGPAAPDLATGTGAPDGAVGVADATGVAGATDVAGVAAAAAAGGITSQTSWPPA